VQLLIKLVEVSQVVSSRLFLEPTIRHEVRDYGHEGTHPHANFDRLEREQALRDGVLVCRIGYPLVQEGHEHADEDGGIYLLDFENVFQDKL